MIIKSMSRKEPSFGQLLDYINRDKAAHESAFFTHNLLSDFDGDSFKEIKAEFSDNAQQIPPRKNGNALYHEILALPRLPEISSDVQARALVDLAKQYLQRRGPHQLGFGRVHIDTNHIHMHLVISANDAFHPKKRCRLPKSEFSRIQRDIDQLRLEHYPELGDQAPYLKPERSATIQQSNGEIEKSRRLKEPSEKQLITAKLDILFATARNDREVLDGLKAVTCPQSVDHS